MTNTTDIPDFNEEVDRRLVPSVKTHPMVLGEGGEHLFAAGVADMDFKPAQAILNAFHKRLQHGVFGYETVVDGLLPAIVEWQKNHHNWTINEEQILRAPNVLNSLALSVTVFTNIEDSVIIQTPVFHEFANIVKDCNRNLVTNPLLLKDGRYEMDFENLERIARNPRCKMLILCNPHNPVGRVWTKDELIRLGTICLNNDVLVASDEIHGDLAFDGFHYTPFASLGPEYAEITISCLSPAKAFNIAGCCSAFTVISNQRMRERLQKENSRYSVNKNNAFGNVGMEAAYSAGDQWLKAAIEYIQNNVALVRSKLASVEHVKLIEPEGTFLLWLDFRALQFSPEALTLFLRNKAGWFISPGESFGQEGEGFARLNIGCPRPKLEAALDKLVDALSSQSYPD